MKTTIRSRRIKLSAKTHQPQGVGPRFSGSLDANDFRANRLGPKTSSV